MKKLFIIHFSLFTALLIMPITTILLDLDDTLITVSMRQFAPAYLDALGQALSRFAPPRQVAAVVLRATQAMQANTDPDVSNYEAFYQAFLPLLEVTHDEIQPVIDRFYREEYPKLRCYVTPRPQARKLAAYLTGSDYQIVIATHPIFPLTAIRQRMDWGGVLDFPYALITAMETAHFSKPNPAYYQEILGQLKVSPAQALMVGDDPENDIAPAHRLGLKTWRITDRSGPVSLPVANHQGTLAEFYERVKAEEW